MSSDEAVNEDNNIPIGEESVEIPLVEFSEAVSAIIKAESGYHGHELDGGGEAVATGDGVFVVREAENEEEGIVGECDGMEVDGEDIICEYDVVKREEEIENTVEEDVRVAAENQMGKNHALPSCYYNVESFCLNGLNF